MIGLEHIKEFYLNLTLRKQLLDSEQNARFSSLSKRYKDICLYFNGGGKQEDFNTPGYEWKSWASEVRESFDSGVPIGFLSLPILTHTMVFARRRGVRLTELRIKYVEEQFSSTISKKLLREDYIGLPTITSSQYVTSANRSHHASHLACYSHNTGRHFWDSATVLEWGGGYGDMARLVRRMNPGMTYIIIDLPEMLALQYIYLASLESESSINLVNLREQLAIVPGKINLISAYTDISMLSKIKTDSFISTWALTESQRSIQQSVLEHDFFGAKYILIGSMINDNNVLSNARFDELGIRRIMVPPLGSLGSGNEYWFR